MTDLAQLGFSDFFAAQVPPDQLPHTARIIAEHRGAFRIASATGEHAARISGRMRHLAETRGDLPAVGDWVLLRPTNSPADEAVIETILERRSCFSRKAAGQTTSQQIVAANIDTVWIVTALDADLSPRRIERYLTLAWESNASPAVILNKSDLCDDTPAAIAAIEAVSPGVRIHAVSALTGSNIEQLTPYIKPGATVALLGSSGVGKSTLINRLAGRDIQATAGIRESDSKGRHTTTARQLITLPSGGLIVDTPGMRELQLWDADSGVKDTFTDIEELAPHCRFSDCTHTSEPGCAVAQAIEEGTLTHERFASYQKLQAELAHLDRKQNAQLAAHEKKKHKAISKLLRDHPKYKR